MHIYLHIYLYLLIFLVPSIRLLGPKGRVTLSLSVSLSLSLSVSQNLFWGTWVAQLVKRPTLAQVMTSQFVSSSPASGLMTQSLEPASDSVSPSLSLCLSPAHALPLSLSLKNKQTFK